MAYRGKGYYQQKMELRVLGCFPSWDRIALVVSKKFGFQMRADDADNIKIFSSLRSLNQHIQTCRTK